MDVHLYNFSLSTVIAHKLDLWSQIKKKQYKCQRLYEHYYSQAAILSNYSSYNNAKYFLKTL